MAAKPRQHQIPDYYALLGVPKDASFREIENAYWANAKNASYRDRIAQLNEAYETLGQTQRREAYDEALAEQDPVVEAPQPAPAPRSNPELASKLQWFLQ